MTQTAPAAPSYEILFAFTGKAGTVLEIKRLGLSADAPRSRKYQWLWVAGGDSQQPVPLRFVSMSQGIRQERVFAQGTLRFDEYDAEMTLPEGTTVYLRACAPDAVPPTAAALAARFVSEQPATCTRADL